LLLALVGAAPFTGEVEIAGQPLNKATLSRVREGIGFVFANPSEQLFCETVAAEVAFGLEQRGLDPAEVSRRVALALGDVGLTQRLRDSPQRLSLGEQRRVAAAAALALLPGLLLFDEPTASLDPLARASVLRSLKQSSSTLVLASHDIEAATELDAEVILINRGQLIGRGAARDVQQNDTLMQRAGLKSSAP
jgi:cobalt/nickel transport system ATP-binding protein